MHSFHFIIIFNWPGASKWFVSCLIAAFSFKKLVTHLNFFQKIFFNVSKIQIQRYYIIIWLQDTLNASFLTLVIFQKKLKKRKIL